jgi:hypothetical protein
LCEGGLLALTVQLSPQCALLSPQRLFLALDPRGRTDCGGCSTLREMREPVFDFTDSEFE